MVLDWTYVTLFIESCINDGSVQLEACTAYRTYRGYQAMFTVICRGMHVLKHAHGAVNMPDSAASGFARTCNF
jgi:hypothetical protein